MNQFQSYADQELVDVFHLMSELEEEDSPMLEEIVSEIRSRGLILQMLESAWEDCSPEERAIFLAEVKKEEEEKKRERFPEKNY